MTWTDFVLICADMKIIHDHIKAIEEELEGAKKYAEKYVTCKAKGHGDTASTYKKMAHDELDHAINVYDMAADDIEHIESIYKLPEHEYEAWESMKRRYAEHIALVRQMLSI